LRSESSTDPKCQTFLDSNSPSPSRQTPYNLAHSLSSPALPTKLFRCFRWLHCLGIGTRASAVLRPTFPLGGPIKLRSYSGVAMSSVTSQRPAGASIAIPWVTYCISSGTGQTRAYISVSYPSHSCENTSTLGRRHRANPRVRGPACNWYVKFLANHRSYMAPKSTSLRTSRNCNDAPQEIVYIILPPALRVS
jgi:hypothetical protein